MDESEINGKMFCRLCLMPTDDYQPLEGILLQMLKAILMNTCLRATENPIICDNCIEKIQKAFEFKSLCVSTELTLTHFTSPEEESKLDLRMVFWIENRTCQVPKLTDNIKICRICLKMIETNHYANLLDTVEVNNLEGMFKIYIPELTLTLTENPLICEKCIENFRTFSAFISTSLDTETKIKVYCDEEETQGDSQVDIEKVASPPKKVNQEQNTPKKKKKRESSIMKLFKNQHLLMDSYDSSDMESDDSTEENERKLMRLIKEEDIDLFYKDRPNFDGHDVDCEESKSNGTSPVTLFTFENHFPTPSSYWDVSSPADDRPQYDRFLEDLLGRDVDSPQPSSSEDSSFSPEPRSRKWSDDKNSDDSSDDPRYEEATTKPSTKRAKKDGRKCRKVYGVESKDQWCTQCRWKKACTRFVNR